MNFNGRLLFFGPLECSTLEPVERMAKAKSSVDSEFIFTFGLLRYFFTYYFYLDKKLVDTVALKFYDV